jgi:chromosome segregation ATPase
MVAPNYDHELDTFTRAAEAHNRELLAKKQELDATKADLEKTKQEKHMLEEKIKTDVSNIGEDIRKIDRLNHDLRALEQKHLEDHTKLVALQQKSAEVLRNSGVKKSTLDSLHRN